MARRKPKTTRRRARRDKLDRAFVAGSRSLLRSPVAMMTDAQLIAAAETVKREVRRERYKRRRTG